MLPTLQEMVDIASRFDTLIAHAVIRACVARALDTGEPLTLPKRAMAMRDPDPYVIEEPDPFWRELVVGNTDTRDFHL